MNNLRFFIPASIIFILIGCRKTPTACFKVDKTSIKTGETVIFTNCSENSTSTYLTVGERSFGFAVTRDFESDTASYTYNFPGSFTVRLEAFNCSNGNNNYTCKKDEITQVITVSE